MEGNRKEEKEARWIGRADVRWKVGYGGGRGGRKDKQGEDCWKRRESTE